ncbi:MAG: thiamine ABC transporter substrate binding subunit, partial [Proteobacteria bacterium]|nr:thiamine ABC transporter substrate binding subunit [Pseudomonadota bacterium]
KFRFYAIITKKKDSKLDTVRGIKLMFYLKKKNKMQMPVLVSLFLTRSFLVGLFLVGLFFLGLSSAEFSFAATPATVDPTVKSGAPKEVSSNPPVLKVYTYDSFTSKWGPGPKLKDAFLKTCQCDVQFVTSADAGTLLGRLRLEGSQTKADVVIGLDSTMTFAAKSLGIFDPHEVDKSSINLPVVPEDLELFLPIDYGWFAFMIDSKNKIVSRATKEKVNEYNFKIPLNLTQILTEPALKNQIIVQDPRTSSVGLGLMLWIKARFGAGAVIMIQALKKQVLTVGQGWSDTYSKFTKGEAPVVLSYTTSEAYHRAEDQTDRYRAVIFDDGHLIQIEVAAVVKTSAHRPLGKSFLKFLLTPEAQGIIAHGNWMNPVIANATGMPTVYDKLPAVNKTLYLPASKVEANRAAWIEEWLAVFSKK